MLMLLIFVFMLTVAASPSVPMDGAKNAVSLCLFAVIPSLFPFFVLNHILLKSGAVTNFCDQYLKFFPKIFNLPPSSASAVILGFLSGYPAGSKAASELLHRGELTTDQYKHLTAFCSNAGPVFITGTVGVGMLNSKDTGLMLFAVHFASAIAVGLMMSINKPRFTYTKKTTHPIINPGLTTLFTEAVYDSMKSVAAICGYVIFFGMINAFIDKTVVFLPQSLKTVASGIIEMTNGISGLASSEMEPRLKLSVISGILGWGGFCVHAQSSVFLKSMKTYLLGKSIQGVLSFIITYFCYGTSGVNPLKTSLILLTTATACVIASKVPRQAQHF